MMKPEDLKRRLNSMIIIVMTPFDKNDEVDFAGLKSNVEGLVST